MPVNICMCLCMQYLKCQENWTFGFTWSEREKTFLLLYTLQVQAVPSKVHSSVLKNVKVTASRVWLPGWGQLCWGHINSHKRMESPEEKEMDDSSWMKHGQEWKGWKTQPVNSERSHARRNTAAKEAISLFSCMDSVTGLNCKKKLRTRSFAWKARRSAGMYWSVIKKSSAQPGKNRLTNGCDIVDPALASRRATVPLKILPGLFIIHSSAINNPEFHTSGSTDSKNKFKQWSFVFSFIFFPV